ncbi:hypothetical protein [Gordonia hankookensis]|uniref:Uncharacterized protein n=1 Tax=Gordonia hankookensis TaxID=589403 RepID=A0ABR7WF74_9ACTN|nr:hypothetical protein [Gordonia hankookensis]MBD1320522.1 hypothetical protein [Gordonia hankookensis]
MAVTVSHDTLAFSFPDVHADAEMYIEFVRTLRVPDDDTTHPLPPGLGSFDLLSGGHIGSRSRPTGWHSADVLLPMWQSEAALINFASVYPFLVRIGVDGVNAVTGRSFSADPDFDAEDYFEVPDQSWLAGFRTDASTVRQFVAAPAGSEARTDRRAGPDDGNVCLEVIPLRGESWEARRIDPDHCSAGMVPEVDACGASLTGSMGLSARGSVTRSIAAPVEPSENWHPTARSGAVLRIVNSVAWKELTGREPHHPPLTVDEYRRHRFPWSESYDDDDLARRSVGALSEDPVLAAMSDSGFGPDVQPGTAGAARAVTRPPASPARRRD